MRHFSCDLCGKDLTASADGRFVVRLEVTATGCSGGGPAGGADPDLDPLEAMADLLDELEADPDAAAGAAAETREFDLCPGCRPRFLADPLGRARRALRFSPN